MKKLPIAFLIAFVGVAFAFPPTFCNGCKPILSHKGIMSKNTLKNKMCESDSEFINMGCFNGEVELTGAIVSAYNNDEDENIFEVRFYPDTNLYLPFLYNSYCDFVYEEQGAIFNETTQKWDCSKVKLEFKQLDFGVKLKFDSKKVFLPKEIASKHLGENGIRAKVRLKDYRIYGEGEAGYEAWATLVEFSPLGEMYEHNKDNGDFTILKYGSKDSFINLRDKPNGNIIARIQASDILYGAKNGQILATFSGGVCLDESALDEWVEVFYLPPNTTKAQEAINGYIYKSQLKTKCE